VSGIRNEIQRRNACANLKCPVCPPTLVGIDLLAQLGLRPSIYLFSFPDY